MISWDNVKHDGEPKDEDTCLVIYWGQYEFGKFRDGQWWIYDGDHTLHKGGWEEATGEIEFYCRINTP